MCSQSDISVNTLQTKNICRCCLVNHCYKEISLEYYFSGKKEVYGDMLRDTFNFEIKNYEHTYCNRSICEDCISRLRDAHSFKLMVVESEKKFKFYLEEIESSRIEESRLSEDLKPQFIKQEDPETFHMNGGDFEADESIDDDEILANVKLEINKKKKNGRVKKKVKNSLKVKDNCENEKINSRNGKDWQKIIEHRGKGPLLRNNSLKLILNSTICPFQWHKSQYRCFCCKQPFLDMNSLKEHTNSFHTIENIEKEIIQQQNCLVKVEISKIFCKICGNQIQDLNLLRTHLTNHNIKFELHEDLLVPFKINADDLHCQICLQTFSTFRLLNIHINRHFQKQVCHICGAGFTNLKFLHLHKSRQHRSLQCKGCNLKFIKEVDKKNHDMAVHNMEREKKFRYPCPMCPDRFLQENLRVQHLVESHAMKRPEHKCEMCPKVFITKSLRNNHMKNVHHKERNHECDICHHFFYKNSDLMRHKLTHTGEKNFSCNICNNAFASKDSLRRHLKRTHVV